LRKLVSYSTTRLDAQLHLLHTNLDNFKSDPRSSQYTEEWVKTFSAEKRTEQISKDLEQYPELRSSMEKLVPDSVQYEEFWKRYYFLRSEIEGEEQKRKDLLKGMKSLLYIFVIVLLVTHANTAFCLQLQQRMTKKLVGTRKRAPMKPKSKPNLAQRKRLTMRTKKMTRKMMKKKTMRTMMRMRMRRVMTVKMRMVATRKSLQAIKRQYLPQQTDLSPNLLM